jgi:GH24 family phage-related lysozyme (muramidase)
MKKFILLAFFLVFIMVAWTSPGTSRGCPLLLLPEKQDLDRFDLAVDCIRKFEGWHSNRHYPYVGYGHRLLPGEHYSATIIEAFADSLLRKDLLQKCSVFRHFGKDSLLPGVMAYNVGEYKILGSSKYAKSKLIQKLEKGDRNIYNEYMSFCKYKGKILPSLKNRRKCEYELLFVH